MDISSLYQVSSGAIKAATETSSTKTAATTGNENMFDSILNSAIDNIKSTNSYISEAENEEIKFAMGATDNTHDLSIALQKASTSLQYTVAVRDKFIEAYREIMQMQI